MIFWLRALGRLLALFDVRRDAAMSEVATSRHKADIVNKALVTHLGHRADQFLRPVECNF